MIWRYANIEGSNSGRTSSIVLSSKNKCESCSTPSTKPHPSIGKKRRLFTYQTIQFWYEHLESNGFKSGEHFAGNNEKFRSSYSVSDCDGPQY